MSNLTLLKYLKPTVDMTPAEMRDEIDSLRISIIELQKRVRNLEHADLAHRAMEGPLLLKTYEVIDGNAA